MVAEGLSKSHHLVDVAASGDIGLEYLLQLQYDLAIIDWELPGLLGIEICQKYRQIGGSMPILFLTALVKVNQKVQALDAGADDYLCKPFSFDELTSRVQALLRRPPVEDPQQICIGDLVLDLREGAATEAGVQVSLTAQEFEILKLLVQSPGQVFSAEEIIERISRGGADSAHSVKQRIMLLRKKLVRTGSQIKTVRGVGYSLDELP